MRQDIFLAGMLGRIAELEALHAIKEMKVCLNPVPPY